MTAAGIYDLMAQQQRQALDHARALAAAGVPIFVAKPARDRHGDWQPDSGAGGCGYWLPQGWQHTRPDPAVIDTWEPGDALAAVMGHGLDLLDVDPRSGGDDTLAGLRGAGIVPTTYAEAATPSGGWHGFIASLGVGSRDGIAPGVDVKAGTRQGDGRGFAFIAPTVRLSKSTGELTAYRWTSPPDVDRYALEAAEDDTGEALAELVRAARRERTAEPATGAMGALSTVSDALAPSPWDDVPATLAEGRHRGVVRLASALRGRGGWRVEDALAYMRAVVWPQIDQGQGGHPYTLEELAADVRDVFDRYEDGRGHVSSSGQVTTQLSPDSDPGAFALDVAAETHRLRVREAAREAVAAEQAGTLTLPPLRSLTAFLAEPDPPTTYRIAEVWPAGGRVVLAAQHKAGKTTLTANGLRSLADGDTFLDTYTTTPARRVILIDDELDENMLRRWLRDQGIDNTDAIDLLPLRGRLSTFNILDPATRARWAEHIGPGDVLILDCLRPALDALGLSEDKDAGRFLEALDELTTAAGITETMVIHHMGHSNERSRGDSRILDWPDAVWKLVKDGNEDHQSAGSVPRYFSAYGRDVDVPESQLTFDADARRLTIAGGSRTEHKSDAALEDVLDVLADAPEGLSGRQIEDRVTELDHAQKVIREAVRRAVRDGLILTRPGPRRATIHTLAEDQNTPSASVRHSASPVRQRTESECVSASIEDALHSLPHTPPEQKPNRRTENCPDCGDPIDGPPLMRKCADRHTEATA